MVLFDFLAQEIIFAFVLLLFQRVDTPRGCRIQVSSPNGSIENAAPFGCVANDRSPQAPKQKHSCCRGCFAGPTGMRAQPNCQRAEREVCNYISYPTVTGLAGNVCATRCDASAVLAPPSGLLREWCGNGSVQRQSDSRIQVAKNVSVNTCLCWEQLSNRLICAFGVAAKCKPSTDGRPAANPLPHTPHTTHTNPAHLGKAMRPFAQTQQMTVP